MLQQVLPLVTLLVLDCRLPVVPVVTAAEAAMVESQLGYGSP
jgi:hypothetical protein